MRFFKLFFAIGMVLCLTATLVYAGTFKSVEGWDYKPVFFADGISGNEGSVSGVDINGEVGHPLTVASPTASCKPSRKWSFIAEVKSGTLPPGLTLENGPSVIKGIPTSRGHWIVEMRAYDLKCEDKYYMGFTQQLRFHISGSGRVIQ